VALPAIGTLYVRNWGGTNWTQPGGPGTTVFPQEAVNVPFSAYPVPGQVISETSGLWVLGCGHWENAMRIFMDYDPMTGLSAAILTCGLCTYIQNIIEPYNAIFNPVQYPILIP
jgi:hypothetical protein